MPASRNEADELRREMEAHLSFLEDEARMQAGGGESAQGAADRAADRFGDAVAHFREALEDMSLRQRALRQALIFGLALGAVLVVGGILATVLILRSMQQELVDLRSQLAASDASLNQAGVSCAILVGRWDDPPGLPNTLRMPVTLDAWRNWVASAGLECDPGDVPGFMWVSQGWVAKGYHIREGQSIWFSYERMQDMSPQLASTAGPAFTEIARTIKSSRCVPAP